MNEQEVIFHFKLSVIECKKSGSTPKKYGRRTGAAWRTVNQTSNTTIPEEKVENERKDETAVTTKTNKRNYKCDIFCFVLVFYLIVKG